MILPTHFLPGAAKSATTWLHACLQEHPEVFVPPEGELDFFSYHYDKPLQWYGNFFREAQQEKVRMDISPSYMIDEQVPERMYKLCPEAHLVFVFRDPIERAYSYYKMRLRGGKVSAAIDEEMHYDSRFVQEGFYFKHLQNFRRFFPDAQIHCFIYEDLAKDPESFLEKFFNTLGVDPSFKPTLLHQKYHTSKSRPGNQWLYTTVVRGVRFFTYHLKVRPVIALMEYLRKKGYTGIFDKLSGKKPYPELTEAKREELRAYYREDVKKLADYLGRDLEEWLK